MTTILERFDEQFSRIEEDGIRAYLKYDPIKLKEFITQELNTLIDEAVKIGEGILERAPHDSYGYAIHDAITDYQQRLQELRKRI